MLFSAKGLAIIVMYSLLTITPWTKPTPALKSFLGKNRVPFNVWPVWELNDSCSDFIAAGEKMTNKSP
ncbi:MAG: hypothetical protein A2306_03210 [Omnitrophica WOR_2 bacterium RIFOXYB2_FULL_38_16]|nr:MAG: hypothetical protein A2243_02270 [Omnitrophica WOR_2 bacterium RIFOXYA2_FULL_38_17]OGX59234.1 MAG: hypothetical protein A2306_03210 [Omnitrophica WOR_2 bacterium RIFOXYB2_FULL_38_16]HBG61138.1 hypothetical protein [Candidatus Omnitrophota bacterium]